MVMLGMVNTRMKDFFDLWILSRHYDFDGGTLAEAIQTTFRRRATNLPTESPTALSPEFADDPEKQRQWKAFLQKGKLSVGTNSFGEVIGRLREFLIRPIEALQHEDEFRAVWKAGVGWSPRGR
jgi:hypothetical protein